MMTTMIMTDDDNDSQNWRVLRELEEERVRGRVTLGTLFKRRKLCFVFWDPH